LLDDHGKIRSQFDVEDVSRNQASGASERAAENDETAGAVEQTGTDMCVPSHENASNTEFEQRRLDPGNPLKRKLEQPAVETWLSALEGADVAEHLPSQPLLLKVVKFFITSFHHWIPYIHKQRLQTKVSSDGLRSDGMDLVLHALVAVSLRHMDPDEIFMDEDQIQQQIKVSRTIVETYGIRAVSIESLQALIFIVFDYVGAVSVVFRLVTDMNIA
jgi:hypothetical protein